MTHRPRFFHRLGLAVTLLTAASSVAFAGEWTGGGDGMSWNDPANWSDGVVPGPSGSATIVNAGITLSTPVTVAQLTMSGSSLLGSGNLTVTGTATIQDSAFSGAGRFTLASGATATCSTSTGASVQFGRRVDVNGAMICTGGGTVMVNANLNIGPSAALTADSRGFNVGNGAVLTNAGSLTIRSRFGGTQDGGRISSSGTLALGSPVPNQPLSFDGNQGAGLATITATGPVILGGEGGLVLGGVSQRCDFLGPVSVAGPVTIGGQALFVDTITAESSAVLKFLPVPATGIAVNGNPAIVNNGSVEFEAGTFNITFPLTGAGSIAVTGATVVLASDQTLAGPVRLRSTAQAQAVLDGAGVLTFAGGLDWLSGELRGAADAIIPVGATLNIGSPVLQSTANRTSRVVRNSGTVNVYTTGSELQGIVAAGQLVNSANVMVWTRGNHLLPLRNMSGGTILATVPPGSTGGRWLNVVENAGEVRVAQGAFELAGTGQAPIAISGRLRSEQGASLAVGTATYAPTSILDGSGAFEFKGTHDLGLSYFATGALTVTSGTVTVRQPIAPAQVTVIGRLVSMVDQVWANATITGFLAGPGGLEISQSLILGGTLDPGGALVIAEGATFMRDGTHGVLFRRQVINRGQATFGPGGLQFDAAVLTNTGTFTLESNTSLTVIQSPSSFVNAGLLRVRNTNSSQTITFAGPSGGNAGLPLSNTGTLEIVDGRLQLNGGGFSTTPIAIPATATLECGSSFSFASPVGVTGAGTLSLLNGDFDCSASSIQSTGRMTLGGNVTLGNAINPSNLFVTGALTLLSNQSWPTFGFGGTIRGPGNLLVRASGSSDWNSGTFEGPGTVTIAPGLTQRQQSSTPIVLKTTLVNQGTFVVNRMLLDGGVVDNRGLMSLGNRIDGTPVGGMILNNGTFGSGVPNAVVASPVRLQNNGTVSVDAGSLTVADAANYDSMNQVLTGGVWTVAGAGVLTLTGADVRSIAPATTVSLLSPNASMPALANLTSNAGTLIIGPGRVQNVSPVGGTFTNSGELSLRAGSQFVVTGNFVQTALGTLRVQITGSSPTSIGRLIASGAVTLGGTLITEFGNGFVPQSCVATFPFITGASIQGGFNATASTLLPGRAARVIAGATTAAVSVRNLADVATIGATTPGDNTLTADDVIVFLNAYFAQAQLADIASLGGTLTPDGLFTPDDLIAFLASFFAGCG